ncbi:MAG TPA: hypothetical protein VNW52_04820 [Burkholderiaceae bacterium]|jgi:hypothetical protein|nr:hypothetical protein [Burkholderiaceae bacterium]
MSKAVAEFAKLVEKLDTAEHIEVGQMFGKACIKVNGKAFISQHNETLVFKLSGPNHQKALAVKGAVLWDPSGKGRPMKEWVALPAAESKHFSTLANAALDYVGSAS